MALRVLTTLAALFLGSSAALAQGISPCPAAHPSSAGSVMLVPGGMAAEPFSSLLIVEAIMLSPAWAARPAPDANVASPSYLAPGLTLVAPTPSRDVDPASAEAEGYAAIDAGPTFVPPASSFVLYRPSYDVPAR
jgi:hypothetical protein